MIKKGEFLAEIDQKGKLLRIYSPISGRIILTNPILQENPEMLNEDPYGKGWICKIQPTNWIEETKNYYLAEEAVKWSLKELERFKDFLVTAMMKYTAEPSMVILQDGGEISDKALSAMPVEIWEDFQDEFLNETI